MNNKDMNKDRLQMLLVALISFLCACWAIKIEDLMMAAFLLCSFLFCLFYAFRKKQETS